MNRGLIQFRKGTHRLPPRRGAIFLLSLAIVVILSGLVLMFAREMRTEAMASANELSALQADAIEQGAEQWLLALVESNPGDAYTITQTNAEAVPVGNGYFWVVRVDPTQYQTYIYGVTDEGGKINLNNTRLTSTELINLPGGTNDIADSIGDWIDTDSNPNANGAESNYYESLAEPYECKNGPLETVEELLLVKNITPLILYGYDLNHDGVLDATEQALAGSAASANAAQTDPRGIFPFVTCYSSLPTTSTTGTNLTNVNNPNGVNTAITNVLGAAKANQVSNAIGNRPMQSLGAFYRSSGLTASDFGQVSVQLTATNDQLGMLNVTTASEQAMMCLPGLSKADADAAIGARATADTSNPAWFYTAIGSSKIAGVADFVTSRSYQYSADIVAMSADGRSFKRVRVVVDGKGTPQPALIVYRKDLTVLGCPLPPEIRAAMRAGKPPPDATQTTNTNEMGAF